MIRRLVALAFLWVAAAGAATPLPLAAPPPDVGKLVPFAMAPVDKPAAPLPDVALPPPPLGVPSVPPAAIVFPAADRPVALVPPPRALPCIGAFLRVASESLECGRARFAKGEYEDAAKSLESAVRTSSERELTAEARYWLGEAMVRLGHTAEADWAFRQAAGPRPALEYETWAFYAGGFTALTLGDAARARDAFASLAAGAMPAPIAGWTRHGLGLAQYAVGQYAEAERTWADLERRGVPPTLVRDVQFWHGETWGRLGDFARAETELRRFTAAGAHALRETGLLRLGWWALAGGHFPDAVAAFRAYLAVPGTTQRPESAWGRGGLVLALAGTRDWGPAREALRAVTSSPSPVALPVALRFIRAALDDRQGEPAEVVVQDLLGGNLTPAVRAWLLLTKGDAHRLEGNRDEARTQYELAQQAQPPLELAQQAAFRLARTNFEMREFAQTVTDLTTLLRGQVTPEVRTAAVLLLAEAAYRANDLGTAESAYRRILVELPQHPEAATARLSLAWLALRQGRNPEAARLFREFAAQHPDHPSAVDALVLASETTLAGGDLDGGRTELDRIIGGYPMHPRTDFARLNRAIVALRAGRPGEATPLLRDWIARSPFAPLLARAHEAFGAALLATRQPAEARREFDAARREAGSAVSTLGLGAVALVQGRWEDATKLLGEARDGGTREVVAAAEYGLAAVALARGEFAAFKPLARAALAAAPKGPAAPRLLYVMTGIAVAERDWQGALATAKQLVAEFPADETADDALVRVGDGAAAAHAWPAAYEAYTLLHRRYAASPFVETSRLGLASAQVETGRAAEARPALEALAAAPAPDPQAWLMLGKAREAAGDRTAAIEAYSRAARESRGPEFTRDALLGHARLLTADRRFDQARAVLEHLLRTDEVGLAVDAAAAIGDTYRQEGDALGAAEFYLTAAYLAPDSVAGRRALLAVGQSLAAAKQPEAAAAAYRKLLAQADLPSDLASAARQGLQSLAR